MNLILKLYIQTKEPKLAESIIKALNPDNVFIPSDLKIDTKIKDSLVMIEISSKNIGRFLNTFNDIMRCLIAIDKSINVLPK